MDAGEVQRVAVIGLGTMGHGIAQVFAAAGCTVRAYDAAPAARAGLVDRVGANLRCRQSAGLPLPDRIDAILGRLSVWDSEGAAVEGAQVVVEAVREDLAVKQELLARLEGWVAAQTVLASNTSSFPMTRMAERLAHPERAINAHWFNPPHLVPVVEVVPGQRTSAQTTALTVALLTRLGKVPVQVNQELPGFLVNRVQTAMMREVFDLWSRGVASVEDIDAAIRGSMGFRLAAAGPLQIADFGGLDVWLSVYTRLVREICSDTDVPGALQALVREGRLGTKSGGGIYAYTPETLAARLAERDRRFLDLARLFYSAPAGDPGSGRSTQ
jgi:3-hydroxybutyryl-CoA dehydrogenase